MNKRKKISIGIVKWFGGYNSRLDKENNYGFIQSLFGEDLYVRKRNLNNCSSLLKNEFVSFFITENENNKLEAINVKKVSTKEIFSFELEKDEVSKLLELFPNLYKEKYKEFLDLFNQLEIYQTVKIKFNSNEVYNQLSKEDWNLAKKWINLKEADKKYDIELARMISARSAEKVAKSYYESLEFEVKDIALTQVTSKIDDWKVCDLKVNDEISVDVKNARFPNNSNFYSDHCIPKFKEDRREQEVKIFGVLSPYIKVKDNEITRVYSDNNRDIRVLGETSLSKIKELEEEFNSDFFKISNTKNFIPEWMFEYPIEFYSEREQILTKFKNTSITYPNNIEYKKLNIRIIPLYIILELDIQNDILEDWEQEFVEGLTVYIKEKKFINMPFLYLYILKHFLKILKKEEIKFHPNKYKELIYFNQEDSTRPLGIYDENKYIGMFITSLSQIFDSRAKEKVQRFTSFRFHKKGLLQGKESLENKYTTIFAYCGGNIEGKGYCGYMPLVIGKENTCNYCKKLICPKCDFCSKDCQRSKKINKVINFLKNEKKELEKKYNYYENKIFDIIYNKDYISLSGKSWSLKSLDKEYITNEVFPRRRNKY